MRTFIAGAMILVAAPIALAQTAAAIPAVKATTPAGCLTEISQYKTSKEAEARAALPLVTTPEERLAQGRVLVTAFQQISQTTAAMAKTCAGRFDVASVAPEELPALADLYTQAGMNDLAKRAVDRAVTATSLSEGERAAALVQAVTLGLREPKSDARNARLESYADELDKMSDAVLDQKYGVHSRLNGYYRADDIDAGIIKHSTWLIDAARASSAEQRKKYGYAVISAYENMAEAWAGQGRNDDALKLLHRASTDLPDLADVARNLENVIARYKLVGTKAAPISASRWLNRPDETTPLEMTGHVTLLEFTAHWCGPCKESYPGIKRLLASYGRRGFRVVMATELYGYFGAERNLTPEAEFDRDRDYFAAEQLQVPIAVADRIVPKNVDGRPVYTPDPNLAAYKVGGIPQIQLIDRQGRIRLIMVGYDDANEPKLAKIIEGLLNER